LRAAFFAFSLFSLTETACEKCENPVIPTEVGTPFLIANAFESSVQKPLSSGQNKFLFTRRNNHSVLRQNLTNKVLNTKKDLLGALDRHNNASLAGKGIGYTRILSADPAVWNLPQP
jgi:hypothetical protein